MWPPVQGLLGPLYEWLGVYGIAMKGTKQYMVAVWSPWVTYSRCMAILRSRIGAVCPFMAHVSSLPLLSLCRRLTHQSLAMESRVGCNVGYTRGHGGYGYSMGVYGICMGSRSLSQPRLEIAWASRWGAYGAMCLGHVGLYMYNNG